MVSTENIRSAAATGINALREMLLVDTAAGVAPGDIERFFSRHRVALETQLRLLLERLLEPPSARLDREWRGRWHLLEKEALWAELDKARRANHEGWLLGRIRAHRPDLATTAESWARSNQLELPPDMAVPQPIPGMKEGQLVVYDVPREEAGRINALPADATGFGLFAAAAYADDDQPGRELLDIAAGYFGKASIATQSIADEADPIRLEQLVSALRRQNPSATAKAVAASAEGELLVRRKLLAAAGATPQRVVERKVPAPVDREHAPSPQDLLAALQDAQDFRSATERTEANIRAVRVLARPSEDQAANWRELMRYSGWGGLSIEGSRALLPEAYIPDDAALVHEYYTPSNIALAIADLLRPWVSALPRQSDGFVMALEPSAGIGRLLNAASTPGFEQLVWTAVEYSAVSAELLQAIRPDLQVVNDSFESYINGHESMFAGKLGLVLANPPYGGRGASFTADRNRDYRESKAYVYFLRRCLDLLAEGGLGLFIIPYGFLTGTGGGFVALRERILKRHHLRAAFRFPSNIFPGAEIVTDLVIFESRGGELPDLLPEDIYICEGKYFLRHPTHILGKEIGVAGDEDDSSRKPRWGYAVEGQFAGFPTFEGRLRCLTCAVNSVAAPPPSRIVAERRSLEKMPVAVQSAAALGERIKRYLTLYASGNYAELGICAALQPDLLEALQAWVTNVGGQPRNPWREPSVLLASKSQPSVVTFLSGFEESGAVIAQIATRPAWAPRFEGASDDLLAQASWLYSVKRELTTASLEEFRQSLGVMSVEPIAPQLIAGGWCFDDGRWLPDGDYYSGLLWDRYYRAKQAAEAGDSVAAGQMTRLASLISPQRIEDIDAEPRMPWIPIDILSKWLSAFVGRAPPKLAWRDSLLQPVDFTYSDLAKQVVAGLQVVIGYINHDLQLFAPKYTKGVDPATGLDESAEQALDRARLQFAVKAKAHFREFILKSADLSSQLEAAYNRLFRGFVLPTYSSDPIAIARWTGRIRLKPHQAAGARRMIANNGGLLGFDVGVGKTYTGIATIAKLREEGRARRAIVVVPNTIIWKWFKDFRTAVPDFRVVVVGSNRHIGKSGAYQSKIDTPEERSLKWRQFQAGEYDVALVTYSVFGRTQVRPQTLRDWAFETPVILRKLSLDSRELAKKIEGGTDAIRKPRITEAAIERVVGPERIKTLKLAERGEIVERLTKEKTEAQVAEVERLQRIVAGLSDLSERERAVFGQALDKWLAQRAESYLEPDPGIYFEDLACDALIVDEAQNFKNLWPVAAREGGIPKYLGAISEGSERAYALAIRAHLVKQRNGGSGVFLLSATPAKNSPLEYFTLLGYVDSGAWAKLGITDPEVFIDRYLRLEVRNIVSADMSIKLRSIVAGFKNLDELRSVIFRFAEFRTAEEVGLVLPRREVEPVTVQMDERQEAKYAVYATKYREALSRSKDDPKARMKALGLLQRMALTAIHSELDEGPGGGKPVEEGADADDEGGGSGWTWRNASKVTNPSCPKLDYVVSAVMKRPDCGHLVFCDNVAVHRWLLILLVAAGFPANRVAVFNGDQAKDPAKRQSLAERFNGTPAIEGENGVLEQEAIPPEFDIVIANATAYEGIDLHIRTCKVYHIDLPWEPATLQQRNGRAVRQGNTQSVIGITYLLSSRSLDAVRLSMIEGKLNWMKDVLASAERETNNPAAQSELSGEEMVLFLARDPEEAKAAIEAQRELLLKEQHQRVRNQAWTALRGLLTRTAVMARISEPAERQVLQTEITALVDRINQIPTTVWQWHFLIPLIQGGHQLLWNEREGWAIAEDSYIDFAVPERPGFATGKILKDNQIGIRRFGGHAFTGTSRDDLSTFGQLAAQDVELGAIRWNADADEAAFTVSLKASFDLPTFSWADVNPGPASDGWRLYLVEHWWQRYLDAAKALGSRLEFLLPAKVAGSLKLLEPQAIEPALEPQVMPFTHERWSEFVNLAVESGIRYSDLNETSLGWWGRSFPRGILRQKVNELADVGVNTSDGVVQVRPLQVHGSLAVVVAIEQGHDHADGPRYVVTHIPSGRRVFGGYKSEAAAEAAMRFANKQSIDWTEKTPDASKLTKGFSPTMKWIRESPEVPSDEAIRQYALQM